MAKPSFLTQYISVTGIPAELSSTLRGMKSGNSHSLLAFVMRNLPGAELGQRHQATRVIRLNKEIWWEAGHSAGFKREVPAMSVDSAVTALNIKLEEENLPYRVWRQCQNGNPRSNRFRPVAPYTVGLVDLRKPLVKTGR